MNITRHRGIPSPNKRDSQRLSLLLSGRQPGRVSEAPPDKITAQWGRYYDRFATVSTLEKPVFSVISGQIALPIFLLRYVTHGAGSAQGRPVAAAPCTPGLRPAKSPLRGTFDLSLQASGRAEAASVQNTALSPHPCGLPRPSGNVSAMLRPPAPAVSARIVNNLTTGCPDRRPDKASAAIRHKYGNRVE